MIKFAFFGSSEFSLYVLGALETKGFLPSVVVTTPDMPKGRGLVMTPTPVKSWAIANFIPVLDPETLDDDFVAHLKAYGCETFIVASYGKIIPEKVLDAAPKKTLNVHPSLLPRYRGASPIQNAILDDARDTGVTIIRLDKEMDHGPIVASEKIRFDEWPTYEETEKKLGQAGGALLAHILPEWVKSKVKETEQDHSLATFTKKIEKEDAELDPKDILPDAPAERAYTAFRKIQAYRTWPVAYFFLEINGKKTRIKITSASWQSGRLVIEKVIPEGKKEMSYRDFSAQ